MISFFVTSIFSFVVYLLLTAGSGSVLRLWSSQEIMAGAVLGLITGFAARKFFCSQRQSAPLNPLRWITAVLYVIGPFFIEMAKANVDVAYRVITGRIRPGIVRVKSGMKTDLGTLMLANSITLTPGTLTVGIDEETNDLFVHMINIPEGTEARESLEAREVFSIFNCPAWIRRIAE
ncbi:MAG TPA: cation:proton antiporter [Verrucomicrobia bacterium]|nr:MAG: cation:proton antiporter [Lentisphaerae bacterium GWF2_57_35]HBA84631.1 cation:proton antiporter [Verrucomicrobiota bacterium]